MNRTIMKLGCMAFSILYVKHSLYYLRWVRVDEAICHTYHAGMSLQTCTHIACRSLRCCNFTVRPTFACAFLFRPTLSTIIPQLPKWG